MPAPRLVRPERGHPARAGRQRTPRRGMPDFGSRVQEAVLAAAQNRRAGREAEQLEQDGRRRRVPPQLIHML